MYDKTANLSTVAPQMIQETQVILTKQVSVRVTEKFHKQFLRKARRHGSPADVHRELLEAFVEDRLTVAPNPKKEKLYDY